MSRVDLQFVILHSLVPFYIGNQILLHLDDVQYTVKNGVLNYSPYLVFAQPQSGCSAKQAPKGLIDKPKGHHINLKGIISH